MFSKQVAPPPKLVKSEQSSDKSHSINVSNQSCEFKGSIEKNFHVLIASLLLMCEQLVTELNKTSPRLPRLSMKVCGLIFFFTLKSKGCAPESLSSVHMKRMLVQCSG